MAEEKRVEAYAKEVASQKLVLWSERTKWRKLKIGMTPPEVESLLGKPKSVAGEQYSQIWTYPRILGDGNFLEVRFEQQSYGDPISLSHLPFHFFSVLKSWQGPDAP